MPETARPLDDLPRATPPDSEQAVRDGPPTATFSNGRRALAVRWELSLQWELKRVSRDSCHAPRSSRSKIVHYLEPRYVIEP